MLRLGAVAAGTLVVGGAAAGGVVAAPSKPSAAQDKRIFNFALVLERLQAAFYGEALQHAGLTGELREFADVVGANERDHVAFLEQALGADAQPAPRFKLGTATRNARTFATTARILEDAGVLAYNGQAANLTKASLTPAAEIVSVEGRHSAWIRDILGLRPAPHPADIGVDPAVILQQLKSNGLFA